MYKQLLITVCFLGGFSLHSQNFLAPTTNDFGLTNVGQSFSTVSLGDLDNDGDLDLISGSVSIGFIYYENTGSVGAPMYAAAQNNPFNLVKPSNGFFTPLFVDLDNDGDLDIMSSNNFGNFYYYENIGNATTPNFAAQVLNPFNLFAVGGALHPRFGDLDSDRDLDIIFGVNNASSVIYRYYENIGSNTNPNYANPINNPFNLSWTSTNNPSPGGTIPFLVDLDNDGDLDLLSGLNDGNFYYFQNIGTPTSPSFSNQIDNPFNLTTGTGGIFDIFDLNNDGDLDILSGTGGDFSFFENTPAPPVTLIPDSNFEQYLIDQGIDTGALLDGQVLTSDIEIVDMVDLTALEISDLTGIEDFIALETLTLEGNPALASIDISALTNLTTLNVKDTGLLFLDVSNNISLINLDVGGLTISSIDLSPLTSLISLSADNTTFANIDISNNLLLEIFSASDAGLFDINLNNNAALTELNLSDNSLVNIDVTDNVNLQILNVSSNSLETLDIVQNANLTSIFASNNNLELAFMANGNNAVITGENFDLTNNPNLTCIAVDDANFADTNWPNKDADATYSENCLAVWTVYTTDTIFDEAIINSGADTNNDGEISYQEAQEYTDNINFSGLGINDVTGLEAFTNANIVDLSDNLIEDINTYLLSDSFIIELEFPTGRVNHDAVRRPKIRVKSLNVSNNNLREVDMSNKEGMESLNVSGNDLESLTLAPGTALTTRSTDNLTFMDARMNANLGCIQVNDVASAQGQASWFLDPGASYSTDCESALSANSFSLDDALNIGPNPTTNIIEITSPNHINLKSISLYSLNGQLLVSTNSNSLNIEGYGIGLYLLRIETDQGTLVKKIIKN